MHRAGKVNLDEYLFDEFVSVFDHFMNLAIKGLI